MWAAKARWMAMAHWRARRAEEKASIKPSPNDFTSNPPKAATWCRTMSLWPRRTCCDYADALRERDGEGDRAKAMSLLDESLAISSELGMRPLMERVLSRREILGA